MNKQEQLEVFYDVQNSLLERYQQEDILSPPPANSPRPGPSEADIPATVTFDDLHDLGSPTHRMYQRSIIPGVYFDLRLIPSGDLLIRWKCWVADIWVTHMCWLDGETVPGESDPSKMIIQESGDEPTCPCPAIYVKKEEMFGELQIRWRCPGTEPTITVFKRVEEDNEVKKIVMEEYECDIVMHSEVDAVDDESPESVSAV